MVDKQEPGKHSFRSMVKDLKEASKKVLEIISGSPRALILVFQASKRYTIYLIFLNLLLAILPLANLWIFKLIIDLITISAAKSPDLSFKALFSATAVMKIIPLLAASALLELVQSFLHSYNSYIQAQLGDLLNNKINERIMRKTASLVDISYFESSKFHDSLQLAQEASYRPIQILNGMVKLFRSTIQFSVLFLSFIVMKPFLCLLVILFSLPSLFLELIRSQESWSMNIWEIPEVKKMRYYQMEMTSKHSAAEIRLFGLSDFFINRYLDTFTIFYQNHKKVRKKHLGRNVMSSVLSCLAEVVALGSIAIQAVTGIITISEFYFYNSALSKIQGQLTTLLWSISSLYEDNLFMTNLFNFLEMKETMPPPDPGYCLKTPKPIKQGIEFRNLSFTYPESDREILSDLSFKIEPGQTIALVGDNGAGKTTIVKLLGRLYDPSKGEILIDGINLKDIDIDDWRSQTAVIFQDFKGYQMTAGENIGVGQVNFIEDEQRVAAAAERGGALTVVEKLPNKYDTQLGNWFENDVNVDLSGGEWQKIALSRAFMRAPQEEIYDTDSTIKEYLQVGAAQLLVLDEPTASLDVQSEHDIYQSFQELTRGKITVLISHRFSTVRMANLILLLEDGKISEKGSHEELIAKGGEYARLYKLQADKYN